MKRSNSVLQQWLIRSQNLRLISRMLQPSKSQAYFSSKCFQFLKGRTLRPIHALGKWWVLPTSVRVHIFQWKTCTHKHKHVFPPKCSRLQKLATPRRRDAYLLQFFSAKFLGFQTFSPPMNKFKYLILLVT